MKSEALKNKVLNKLKVPPHKLGPFKPKFENVDSRTALGIMNIKRKKNSVVP